MLALIDTCVMIDLREDSTRTLYSRFKDYLTENGYRVLITDFLLLELCQKPSLAQEYIDLIINLPFTISIPSIEITEAEFNPYPRRLQSIEMNTREKKELIQLIFYDEGFLNQVKEHQHRKELIKIQINKFKRNKINDPNYIAFKWINNNAKTLGKTARIENSLNVSTFPSELIRAYIAYENYIVKRIKPVGTDMGDFLMMGYLPYCDMAIIEDKLSNCVNEIKSKYNLAFLRNKKIESLRTLKKKQNWA